jgi:hypothetical protein
LCSVESEDRAKLIVVKELAPYFEYAEAAFNVLGDVQAEIILANAGLGSARDTTATACSV